MRQQYGTLSIEPPSGWGVHTVLTFVARDTVDPPNIVVTRGERPTGDSLRTFVMRELLAHSQDLTDFALAEIADVVVGTRPAFRTHFGWVSERGPIEQFSVHVDAGESITISFTCTVLAPTAEVRASMLEAFAQMLASVDLVGAPSGPRATASVPPPHEADDMEAALSSIPMPGTAGPRRSAVER